MLSMFGFSKGVLVQGNDVLCFLMFFVFAEFVGIKSACKSYDCFVECELYIYLNMFVLLFMQKCCCSSSLQLRLPLHPMLFYDFSSFFNWNSASKVVYPSNYREYLR